MTSAFEPTEDMLAVLAEVENDPRSKFFGRNAKIGQPPVLDSPLTGGEPFLTRAERKLVRAYREELEYKCYSRGVFQLCRDRWVREKVVNYEEVESRVTRMRSRSKGNAFLRLQARQLSSSQSALSLFDQALAVIHRDSTVTLKGVWFQARRMHSKALGLFASVIATSLSPSQVYSAALNSSVSCLRARSYIKSRAFALAAVKVRSEGINARLMALVAAGVLRDFTEAERQEHYLRGLGVKPAASSVARFAATLELSDLRLNPANANRPKGEIANILFASVA